MYDKYQESAQTREKKSNIAEEKPRDSEGHFIHQNPPAPGTQEHHNNKIIELLQENVHYSKKQDDLLNIHVGNPLRRITVLLEQIKKQKAFSFSIKGSLGLMGVVLVAGTFGVLGVGNVLCDKGVQTRRGVLEALVYKENTSTSIFDFVPILNSFISHPQQPRKILNEANGDILHVVTKNGVNLSMFLNQTVTLSGNYDSCSETITVNDASGVQFSPPQSP